MKRTLFFIFFIVIFFLLSFLWYIKGQEFFPTPKNQTISEIKFFQNPLNLKIPTDYNLKKVPSISFNPTENEKKSKNAILNFGKCQTYVDTPDALFNRLKNQPSNKTEGENGLYQIDCGIIQTSFPLSF